MRQFSWARTWFSIFGSFDFMSLDEANRYRWLALTVIVRCKGSNGILKWSDKRIAGTLRISLDEWQKTKQLFASPECEYIEILEEGIKIINYQRWQPEYDSSTRRVKEWRDEQKGDEVKK